MNLLGWVDFILIGVVALSAGISLLRGFFREALALVGWVAAVWLALTVTEPVASLFAESIELPSVRSGLAFLIVFVGTLILSGVVVWLVGMLVEKTGLSGTDRMLGMVFGVARGVIIAALLVLLAGLTPLPRDPWWQESVLVPHVQPVAEQMRTLLPPEIARLVNFAATVPAPGPGDGDTVLNPEASG
jgi:membrane protein required for colicin V production